MSSPPPLYFSAGRADDEQENIFLYGSDTVSEIRVRTYVRGGKSRWNLLLNYPTY